MSEDLTTKVFAGMQRMIDASVGSAQKAMLLSVEKMIEIAVKSVPAGPVGPQGAVGAVGPQGAAGEPGERGADGAPGERGSDAPPGPSGPEGPQGPQGPQGGAGAPGQPGERGTDGESLPGPAGPQGEKGLDGRDGRDGIAGMSGPRGERGADGSNGRDGRDSDITKAEMAAAVATEVQKAIADLLMTVELDGRTLKMAGNALAKFALVESRGVYQPGIQYDPGDVVAWGGSGYLCVESTTDKPEMNTKAWKLIAKKGRDGKDAK